MTIQAEGTTMLGGYKHIQPTPSLVWVVEHHLGWDPAGIVVRDQADARQLPTRTTPMLVRS